MEIIGICVINVTQVFAKVFDVSIEEINKIVSLVLCKLFESILDVIPIFLVSNNVNKLIHDVTMSYDIRNQELELYNFPLLVFFLVLVHLIIYFFHLLNSIGLSCILLNHISILGKI